MGQTHRPGLNGKQETAHANTGTDQPSTAWNQPLNPSLIPEGPPTGPRRRGNRPQPRCRKTTPARPLYRGNQPRHCGQPKVPLSAVPGSNRRGRTDNPTARYAVPTAGATPAEQARKLGKPGPAIAEKNRNPAPPKRRSTVIRAPETAVKGPRPANEGTTRHIPTRPDGIRETGPRTANPPMNQQLKPRPPHGRNQQRWPAANRRTQGKFVTEGRRPPRKQGNQPQPLNRATNPGLPAPQDRGSAV